MSTTVGFGLSGLSGLSGVVGGSLGVTGGNVGSVVGPGGVLVAGGSDGPGRSAIRGDGLPAILASAVEAGA